MTPKGDETRTRLLDAAERAILQTGFSGLSLGNLLKSCGLTKGAFFHHFSGRNALGRAVLERHAARELRLFAALHERAARKTDDPLQRLLLYLSDIETIFSSGGPSLIAHFACEREVLDSAMRRLLARSLLRLHAQHARIFRDAFAGTTPAIPVAPDDLATMLLTLVEGAYISASAGIAAHSLASFRTYAEMCLMHRENSATR